MHTERFSELYPENIQPPNSREMVSIIDLGGLWVLQAFDHRGDGGPDGIGFGTETYNRQGCGRAVTGHVSRLNLCSI